MNINRYNTTWIICLGILFFLSYGAVNHFTAFLDTVKPIPSFVFSWENIIPFIPIFIYPYMSIDILYALAFFIIPKHRYDNETYKLIIKGLGLQLLVNQLMSLLFFLSFPLKYSFDRPEIPQQYEFLFNTLLNFDLPYNQTPSLHISILVILCVFFNQHIAHKWIKNSLNIWFVLIGASILFTYQHHIIDLFMGLFWGMALVLMFNYSTQHKTSLHINEFARTHSAYKKYVIGIVVYSIVLFVLPWTRYLIDYEFPPYLYIFLWFGFVSLLTIFKIMFFGNTFSIRNNKQEFRKTFKIVAGLYLYIRKSVIHLTNYYKNSIEVLPYLYITNSIAILKENLGDKDRVINLAWEISHKQKNTHSYPLIDLIQPRPEQVLHIIKDMNNMIQDGNKVYVHCALGIFRTIFISGSYIVKYENKTPEEVFDIFYNLPLHIKMKSYLKRKETTFLDLWHKIKNG